MSKINNTPQKKVSKPIKRPSSYEESDHDDEGYLDFEGIISNDTKNETLMLAQFLATTGPEEFEKRSIKKQQQFKTTIRLLNRLYRNTVGNVARQNTAKPLEETRKHIPLPAYEILDNNSNENINNNKRPSIAKPTPLITSPAALAKKQDLQSSTARDLGIYSETTSEKEYTSTAYSPVFPLPPFNSVMNDLQFPRPPYSYGKLPEKYPSRPAPLPPSAASNTVSSACSPTSTISGSTNISDTSIRARSVPEAALKRRSVKLRHVQVQTQEQEKPPSDTQPCPHCKHSITGRVRRPSCPPSLASGPALLTKDTEDSKVLLAMILKLRTQLDEEKQCRLRLEKAIRLQQKESDGKKEQLALEKEKWALDSLWLHDRIALLPE